MKPQVSIVLLVNNEAVRLSKLFLALFHQKTSAIFELIIIDSGSTDSSLECVARFTKKYPKLNIRLFQIKPKEFGHGKTRNYGVQKSKAKIIVFLVADALPKSNNWLSELIKPLKQKNVVGSFGRQIPYDKTLIYDKFFYHQAYPSHNRRITKKNTTDFSITNIYFSNCNGAVKTEFLKKYPFPNYLVMSEDQWWAWEVLKRGYEIKYVANAAVYHSHNYSLASMFRKQFTSGYSLIGFSRPTFIKSVFYTLVLLAKETWFIGRNYGILALLGIFIYEPVRYAGFILGSLGNHLPQALVKSILVQKHPRF